MWLTTRLSSYNQGTAYGRRRLNVKERDLGNCCGKGILWAWTARIARFCCATRPRRCVNTITAEVDMRRSQCDWWDRLFHLIWEQRDQRLLNTQLASVADCQRRCNRIVQSQSVVWNWACSVHYERVSAVYIHLWQTLICLFCKRRLYISVPPSLAILISCCTIGYDINRTTMMVVTERSVMERLGCQEMPGRI
jgi:hypothetical protein